MPQVYKKTELSNLTKNEIVLPPKHPLMGNAHMEKTHFKKSSLFLAGLRWGLCCGQGWTGKLFFHGTGLKDLGGGRGVPVQANLGGASLKTFSRGCQFTKSPCIFHRDKLSFLTGKKQNTLREPFYA